MIFWLSGQQWLRSGAIVLANLLLAPAATVITTVIRNDIALSLGMVGALSIVRFRNPVRSPAELTLYFTTLVIGISCTVDKAYPLVMLGVAVVGLVVMFLAGKVAPDLDPLQGPGTIFSGYMLVVENLDESAIEPIVDKAEIRSIEVADQGMCRLILRCRTYSEAIQHLDKLRVGGEGRTLQWNVYKIES